MTKYSVWIQKVKPYKVVFGATIEVNSKEELEELEHFLVAGINAYEDWKAERNA